MIAKLFKLRFLFCYNMDIYSGLDKYVRKLKDCPIERLGNSLEKIEGVIGKSRQKGIIGDLELKYLLINGCFEAKGRQLYYVRSREEGIELKGFCEDPHRIRGIEVLRNAINDSNHPLRTGLSYETIEELDTYLDAILLNMKDLGVNFSEYGGLGLKDRVKNLILRDNDQRNGNCEIDRLSREYNDYALIIFGMKEDIDDELF